MTDFEELERLLAAATPELLTCKPERLEQMLRDGAAAQRPQPDNLRTHDFLGDAKLILTALNQLPALLAETRKLRSALVEMVEEHIKRGPFDEPLGESEQSAAINRARALLAKLRPTEGEGA